MADGARRGRGAKAAGPDPVAKLRAAAWAKLSGGKSAPAPRPPARRRERTARGGKRDLRARLRAAAWAKLSGGKSAPAPRPPAPRRERTARGGKRDLRARLRAAAWAQLCPRIAAPAIAGGAAASAISPVVRKHLKGVIEALIFASDRPMPAREVARAANAEHRLVRELLAEIVADFEGRGFRLDEVGGGYVFRTNAAFAPFVRVFTEQKAVRMSRAQVETLAIVAYRQPITRPEIDEVRGVDSGAALKSLLERELVRILGKKDEPGRPILYGTTPNFLEFFGLRSLGDLPTLREFTELTDDSKRTYERELGEEPPDLIPGFAGGEGEIRMAVAEDATAGDEPRLEEDMENEKEEENSTGSDNEDEDTTEDEDDDDNEDDDEDDDEDDEDEEVEEVEEEEDDEEDEEDEEEEDDDDDEDDDDEDDDDDDDEDDDV